MPVPIARGRPRSERKRRAILDATRQLLIEEGYPRLYLEHVAARAGVGKATIYRRWRSKEALVADLLDELASPHIAVPDTGDTRQELLAAVTNPIHALSDTDFGPVIRALLGQIAVNPTIGDPFRDTVVRARREEIARVVRARRRTGRPASRMPMSIWPPSCWWDRCTSDWSSVEPRTTTSPDGSSTRSSTGTRRPTGQATPGGPAVQPGPERREHPGRGALVVPDREPSSRGSVSGPRRGWPPAPTRPTPCGASPPRIGMVTVSTPSS